MNKEKLYFDTSVLSAYYDKRTKERMEFTKEFWGKVDEYELYISTLVIDELNQTEPKILKDKLLKLVDGSSILELYDEVENLAAAYVKAGIYLRNILMMRFTLLWQLSMASNFL